MICPMVMPIPTAKAKKYPRASLFVESSVPGKLEGKTVELTTTVVSFVSNASTPLVTLIGVKNISSFPLM